MSGVLSIAIGVILLVGPFVVTSMWWRRLWTGRSRFKRPDMELAAFFTRVCLMCFGLATLVALTGCGDEYERGAGVYPNTATVEPVQTPTVPVRVVPTESSEARPPSRRQRRLVAQAKRDARVFLDGYLRFTAGEDVRVRRVFPQKPPLLPPEPPRVPLGAEPPERARLERGGLEFVGTYRGRVLLTVRTSDGQVRTLTMRRRGGGWAVERVR